MVKLTVRLFSSVHVRESEFEDRERSRVFASSDAVGVNWATLLTAVKIPLLRVRLLLVWRTGRRSRTGISLRMSWRDLCRLKIL